MDAVNAEKGVLLCTPEMHCLSDQPARASGLLVFMRTSHVVVHHAVPVVASLSAIFVLVGVREGMPPYQ